MQTPATPDTPNQQWPLPKFYFTVDFGEGITASFQEVSGLETETQVIEYRGDNNPAKTTIKMPGIAKYGNVTLKKGVFAKIDPVLIWEQNIAMNTVKRVTVTIKLLNESGAITMGWQLNNAWPTKITGVDLQNGTNETVIETIEFAHEGIVVTDGK